MELDGVVWNDWGRPHRILDSLRNLGRIGKDVRPSGSVSRRYTASRADALGTNFTLERVVDVAKEPLAPEK